ncbi:MAG: DUF554 domain-containing protein [Spirochaetales bacterium]|nr:DUF554 domain-containing protein [Spirochaetales bacterium]
MPLGVIIDALAVLIGGLLGTIIGSRLEDDFKQIMNNIMGICSMTIGISSIILMRNMPPVVFSIIVGTLLGLAVHLGEKIQRGGVLMEKGISRLRPHSSGNGDEEFRTTLVTCITLFCASGTGIYGALTAGMVGDHSILIAKAILDFFTAIIFGCSLGAVAALVAIPQFIIFFLLFLLAGAIYPFCTDSMICDFKAAGGVIMLATGLRMCKIKMFPVADMIPAMVIVMPASGFWVNTIMPVVSHISGV